MMISAHPHPQAPGLPPQEGLPPPSLLGPFAGLLGVVALALAASLVLVQTRPAEFKTPPAPTPSAPTAPPAPASAAAFNPPDLHPTPPRVPALAGARPSGPPPLSFALLRQGPSHHAPLPPSPGSASFKGVYGTQKACAQCGWVESVQSLSVGSGGLPPGAAVAAGAALGAQAGANRGTAAGTSAGGYGGNPAAAAAGAVIGAQMGARAGQARQQPAYEVNIRMEDGSQRVFELPEPLPLGAAVVVEGGVPRLAPERGASASTGTGVGTGVGTGAGAAGSGKAYGTSR
ncbi:hypothetical protein [Curvibacter lanceolatus]|jgi:hypothetical protein|uniref:hypothetical protein n=1 Tax=Curvibacter lanceolatus TaxID=86182 RepID=UPI000362E477|nr:hypothetical protein [Curvibacter lanceolatus]